MTDQPRQPGLAAALAALQAELPPVAKGKTADVKNKEGKYLYSYKYADLADVSAAVMPLMGKHGLAFTCQPTIRDDGKFGLAYQLMHESGELIDGWYPLDDRMSVQQIGGHITYARRYVLCALTGVAAEEDTDGQGLEQAAPSNSRQRGRPPVRAAGALPRNADGAVSRSRTTEEELEASGNMTSAQLREHNKLEREVRGTGPQGTERLTATPDDDKFYQPPLRTPQAAPPTAGVIHAHWKRLGYTDSPEDRAARLKRMSAIVGRPVTSTSDLTAAEGLAMKEVLQRYRDMTVLDEWLALEAGEDIG